MFISSDISSSDIFSFFYDIFIPVYHYTPSSQTTIVRLTVNHKIILLSDNYNLCFDVAEWIKLVLKGLEINLNVCVRYGFRSTPKTTKDLINMV